MTYKVKGYNGRGSWDGDVADFRQSFDKNRLAPDVLTSLHRQWKLELQDRNSVDGTPEVGLMEWVAHDQNMAPLDLQLRYVDMEREAQGHHP